jgi:hypothetical protein
VRFPAADPATDLDLDLELLSSVTARGSSSSSTTVRSTAHFPFAKCIIGNGCRCLLGELIEVVLRILDSCLIMIPGSSLMIGTP